MLVSYTAKQTLAFDSVNDFAEQFRKTNQQNRKNKSSEKTDIWNPCSINPAILPIVGGLELVETNTGTVIKSA